MEKTLQDVEMSHRRNARVSELSGGQRKRVSIGVELLADPKLFFLDEPTSGLDPGLDKKMMQLLRKLADQGRTVILVTHATANIKLCDRVVFLGQGGRLCLFLVPPDACLQFFGVKEDFADIYNQLEKSEAVHRPSAKNFTLQTIIAATLPITSVRVIKLHKINAGKQTGFWYIFYQTIKYSCPKIFFRFSNANRIQSCFSTFNRTYRH